MLGKTIIEVVIVINRVVIAMKLLPRQVLGGLHYMNNKEFKNIYFFISFVSADLIALITKIVSVFKLILI